MTTTRWLISTILLLIGTLAMGMGIVLFAIAVVRAPSFPGFILTPYGQVQDHAFEMKHADCEIVIYGDSSTMTSDDSKTIAARTGLSTCNLSQTQPVVVVTGMLPVELYLKQNKLPKYMVLQFAPEAFYQSHGMAKAAVYDPMTLMLRQDPGVATARILLRSPLQTMQYASLVLQDRYRPNKKNTAAFKPQYEQVIARYWVDGLLTLPKPSETACGPAKPLPETPDFAWVEQARQRYTAQGVKVLVTVSPIPDCDSQQATYKADLAGHLDGAVTTLPLKLFNDSDRHFTREGAAIVSAQVAQQILALESQAAK